MKKEYIVIVVLVGLAAVWYFFFRDKSNAAAIASTGTITPPVTSTGGGGAAIAAPAPTINATPPVFATAPGPSQTLAVQIPASGPVVSNDSVIFPWFESLDVANKTQAYKMYPVMTSAEKAALADIIENVWSAPTAMNHRPETIQDTNFWNAWRVKYHILDGTYA